MHPAVRRVIPVAVRRWRRRIASLSDWSQATEFRRALRAEAYDCVVDSQGLLKSALIAWQARGTVHGFDASSAREPVASWFYAVRHRVGRELHAVERNRALSAAALGIAVASPCDYGLRAPPGKRPAFRAPYCVLLSMTSRPDKLWPDAHWVNLVKALRASGLESVLPWGSDAEQARCRRIVERAGAGIVAGAMSLVEIAGVLSGAQAVVGVDTGLSHLSVALGVPAVGLYCSSDPRLTGLYGSGKLKNLGGPGSVPSPSEAMSAIESFA